jgi:prepilin-type N-terminal cleavage/methylation domain-containing protein
MLNRKKKLNEGFTIIEVMIVLAIAGLILLIVFLAVPALTRSNDNTDRKQAAGRIGSAINDYVSNNNGSAPTTAAELATIMQDSGSMPAVFSNFSLPANQCAGAMKTKFICITGTVAAAAPTIVVAGANTDAAEITYDAQCATTAGTNGFGTAVGTNDSQVALQYTVDNGGTDYYIDCINE